VASVAGWILPAAGLVPQYPALQAWLSRCLERPAYKQARGMR